MLGPEVFKQTLCSAASFLCLFRQECLASFDKGAFDYRPDVVMF